MRLIDPDLLASYMAARDMTGGRLGRIAGCSRQFIGALRRGERSSASPEVARAIESGLELLPGTLFRSEPDDDRSKADRRESAAA